MNMTKAQQAEAQEAITTLRELLAPGDTVYTILNHVARSGMARHISLVVPVLRDGRPAIRDITWHVGRALGYTRDERDGGLKVRGSGMDMGWHLVYQLGRVLFPDGGPLEASPRERQQKRAGETRETDGGYLLQQTWL